MKTSIVSSAFKFLNSKFTRVLDWTIALGFIAYAIYDINIAKELSTISIAFLVLGSLGIFLSIKRPSDFLEKKIKSNIKSV